MKIIHKALVNNKWIDLVEIEPGQYGWFDGDLSLGLKASTIPLAFSMARKNFSSFKPISAGYKYTLPERDEHGKEALYYEAVKSLESPNGVFFDEFAGHNAVVHLIPQKTIDLIRGQK